VSAQPDHGLDLGRFPELAATAVRHRLGLYILPPKPGEPVRNENDWLVGVIGETEGEPLGFATTLAEAIGLSFLPLDVYVRAGLAEEFDFDATALPDRVTADSFTTALQPFAELTARAAEHGCGLYFEPPWPTSRKASGHWVIGLLGDEASGPLALGQSFSSAVISVASPFVVFERDEVSSVAGSLLPGEASETVTAGRRARDR
jgi:hypothetical protein